MKWIVPGTLIFFNLTVLAQQPSGPVKEQAVIPSRNTVKGFTVNFNWEETEPYVNGFAKVLQKSKWTFIDRSGRPLCNAVYDHAFNFRESRAAVERDSRWGFIDETGKEIIGCQYEIVFNFSNGAAIVYDGSRWMKIDKSGNVLEEKHMPEFPESIAGGKLGSFQFSLPAQPGELADIRDNPISRTSSTCPPNISFEGGNFTNWNCFTGTVRCANNNNMTTMNPSPPTANRHTLISRTATPVLDPYGFFPINPPNGSMHCLRLGNTSVGAEAERISYTLQVPANAADYTVTYYYAVVFEDPSHSYCQQPRFSARLFDPATNSYLPCGTYEYVSSSNIPGFSSSPRDNTVKFKPWSQAFINLSPYAGRTLQLEFTTVDCTQRGHWGYAYLDVSDACNLVTSVAYNCAAPHPTTITAPPGFQSYNWWDAAFSAPVGTGQTLQLNPGYPLGTQLWVEVIPYSGLGCRDTLPVTITATYPNGNLAQPADTTVCEGSSVQLTASGGTTYQWYRNNQLLPGATGATYQATQPGTYTVEVVSALSCRSWVNGSVVLTETLKPAANFEFPYVCVGTALQFNNTTVLQSQAPVNWHWDFGDGTQSTLRNPEHTFGSIPGQPVTLRVTPVYCPGLVSTVIKKVNLDQPKPGIRYPAVNAMLNSSTPLQARDIGTKFQWSPVTGLSNPLIRNPIFQYDRQTEYKIRITSTTGCVTTDTQLVRIFRQPDIFVPSAFTPNGDGQNDKLDVFYIGMMQLRYFRVFNRWGQLLFETKDPAQRWDGTYNGVRQPLETYVWIAEMLDEKGAVLIRRGQSILVR